MCVSITLLVFVSRFTIALSNRDVTHKTRQLLVDTEARTTSTEFRRPTALGPNPAANKHRSRFCRRECVCSVHRWTNIYAPIVRGMRCGAGTGRHSSGTGPRHRAHSRAERDLAVDHSNSVVAFNTVNIIHYQDFSFDISINLMNTSYTRLNFWKGFSS